MPKNSAHPTTAQPGSLYVVATPIGNLEDMSFRAVRILQTVDLIAAEDTRHTGKLLQHFQITTPQLSFYEHNTQQRLPALIQQLQQGKAIALVSDAGLPTIADPGYELVCACAEAGIPVIPIPGANAALTALTASGLPATRFVFDSFLPMKGPERRDRLQSLGQETRTIILYEAPHKLRQTLAALRTALGDDRQIVIARELTKLHEEFWRGTLAAAIVHYTAQEPKGEFTLVIAGAGLASPSFSESALKDALQELLAQGLSRSQASRQLAQSTNLPRRDIYQLALTLTDTPIAAGPETER